MVELGIVLVILLGWQFAAAEFIGGPIMIILLALVGGWVFQRRLTDPVRQQLQSGTMAGHEHTATVGVSDEYWLYRNRERLGGGQGYAIDPTCGMQVQTANAPAHRRIDGTDHWFCSDHCAERFDTTVAGKR